MSEGKAQMLSTVAQLRQKLAGVEAERDAALVALIDVREHLKDACIAFEKNDRMCAVAMGFAMTTAERVLNALRATAAGEEAK